VLKHSGPGDEFQVSLEVDDDRCCIRVVDTGHGFDSQSVGFSHADTSAEQGRGIEIMRALVDSVKFISKPEAGTVVHLEKTLEFDDDSFVSRSKTAPGR
jgi:serine/threonine-protein kinase RsbW